MGSELFTKKWDKLLVPVESLLLQFSFISSCVWLKTIFHRGRFSFVQLHFLFLEPRLGTKQAHAKCFVCFAATEEFHLILFSHNRAASGIRRVRELQRIPLFPGFLKWSFVAQTVAQISQSADQFVF